MQLTSILSFLLGPVLLSEVTASRDGFEEGGGRRHAAEQASGCDFKNVVITELASPKESYAKYIELYFHNCGGMKITEDYKILRFAPGRFEPANIIEHLQGKIIRDDGFVTICNSANAELYYGRDECTAIAGLSSGASLSGIETIAVVHGNLVDHIIIDMYGIPGEEAVESKQYFKNGRAVRKIQSIYPSLHFRVEDWHVFPGTCKQEVGPEGMDINEWKDAQGPVCPGDVQILISEIVDLDVNSQTQVPRYVELYAPRRRDRGTGINMNLKLVIFFSHSLEPHWNSAIPIDYMPENGFLVVCNKKAHESYGDKCAHVSYDIAGPANSNGDDQIALIVGDESGWFVVDIFGVIGEDGYDTDHDFFNSRVIRKLDVTDTRAKWSKYDWTICKDGDIPDPNKWDNDECGGAEGAPSVSPSSAPTPISQKDCEFFFTELADYENKPYIEIKSTCPGAKISRDVKVVSWKKYAGLTCDVELKGVVVPNDGFIIICSNKIQHREKYGGRFENVGGKWRDLSICDIEDYNLLAGHGFNSYAIKDDDSSCDKTDCDGFNCYSGCNDKYLDIYGYPGSSLVNTGHKFESCRAVRKMQYPFGYAPFNPEFYEVICQPSSSNGQPDDDADPRVWKEVPLVLFFTEFCNPADESKRFIELYSPNKRNYKIKDDLIVMKWEGTNTTPSYGFQSLKNKFINENGFLVLCVNYYSLDQGTCDLQTGFSGIANSNGDDHFALAKCKYPGGNNCSYIDMYGRPGVSASEDIEDFTQDFSNGRAYRFEFFHPVARKVFDKAQWIVNKSVCTPGVLDYGKPPSLTPPNPAPAPAPAPTPSGKKSKKSKRRLRYMNVEN